MTENGTIIATGATGYVGPLLVTRPLVKGYRVRATGRSLDRPRKHPRAIHPAVKLCASTISPNILAQGISYQVDRRSTPRRSRFIVHIHPFLLLFNIQLIPAVS